MKGDFKIEDENVPVIYAKELDGYMFLSAKKEATVVKRSVNRFLYAVHLPKAFHWGDIRIGVDRRIYSS